MPRINIRDGASAEQIREALEWALEEMQDESYDNLPAALELEPDAEEE